MKKRYNIMLNPAIVAKIDYHARELDKTRSDLINFMLFDQLRQFGDVPDESDTTDPIVEGQIDLNEVMPE